MDWQSFWIPNILQSTLFAAISAIVLAGVGIFARRWFGNWAAQIFGEQVKATNAAQAAASRASEAVEQSRQASAHAADAGDNSRQANEAVLWMANELSKANSGNEYLKTRVDDLLAALAAEQAARPVPTVNTGPIRDTDETVITGRHRLHTSMIPTTNSTPTQDDDFL